MPEVVDLVQHLADEKLRGTEETDPDQSEPYATFLFELTHRRFDAEEAKRVWFAIIDHERALAQKLDRSVGLRVAALDHLLNIRGLLDAPTLISEEQLAHMATMAVTDGLTGLVSHSPFLQRLSEEAERYSRYGNPFALLMLDLDDFKRVNDERGHQAGDEALRGVASRMSRTVRDSDVVGRYGGEEFAVLAPETEAGEAVRLAERIRSWVERDFARTCGLTVSVGVAVCPVHAESARRMVECADEALYQAKRRGKNVVTLYR